MSFAETAPAIRVLLADNQEKDRENLRLLISSWKYTIETAADGEEAYHKLLAAPVDILLTDLILPGLDGFELLRRLQSRDDAPAAVVLSTIGENRTAENAARDLGAFCYCAKPVEPAVLRGILERAGKLRRLTQDHCSGATSSIAGNTPEIRRVLALLRQVAPSRASVLITGESGTGKELAARAIHAMSPRSRRPFVAINCAAFPEGLVESEIFGHEKGAFTGALERRAGCLELANGGTLLLDEIGELPLNVQAKLLRVLDDSRVRRIGGRGEIQFDVRVIAATNCDPAEAVRCGHFRQDLYYRLNVFHIALPSLRERIEDLPDVCGVLVDALNRKHGRGVSGVEPAVLNCFRRYSWPGNVRELRNVLETAVILAGSGPVGLRHLPEGFADHPGAGEHGTPEIRRDIVALPMGTTVEQAEKALIEFTLEQTGNNKSRAAKILAISPKTLHCKLRQYRARAKSAGIG